MGGDEFLRTQQGNNNAYCQDNAISWFDWDLAERTDQMITFVQKAITLTRRFPVFQRRRFELGEDLDNEGVLDLKWFAPDGNSPDWSNPESRTLCSQLDTDDTTSGGVATRLFLILNADYRLIWVHLPALEPGRSWHRVVDTSLAAGADFAEPSHEVRVDPADHYIANARSTVVLVARGG